MFSTQCAASYIRLIVFYNCMKLLACFSGFSRSLHARDVERFNGFHAIINTNCLRRRLEFF